MTYLFRYSLSFVILILIHAKRKEKQTIKHKRDLSDLKDDPILTSIFTSDLQEKRNDRSLADEKVVDKNDNFKQQELLKNMLMSAKDLYRRDTLNSPPYDGALNSSLTLPDSYYASLTNPIIGGQIPLPASSKLSPVYNQANSVEGNAVVPKLFAANYLPLANQMMSPALPVSDPNGEVSKRDSIVRPNTPQSSSLHLRKYPPIKGSLRGVVPHTTEYGETVESIERAQKEYQLKKSMLPPFNQMGQMPQMPQMLLNFAPVSQAMYSPDVIKKDTIPGLPPSTAAATNVDDTPKISAPVPVELAPKASDPGAVDAQPQISDPVAVDVAPKPSAPSGVETVNPEQKSNVAAASQVQNLDGAYTRPIITDEECADQYTTCEDFAKNNYCTKYYNLMKIQCRKSCGFCDPNAKTRQQSEAVSALLKAAANKSVEKKDETPATPATSSANASTPQADADKKVAETSKNETKGTKRSSTAKTSKPAESHKKSSDTTKRKSEATKKTTVSSKKSAEKSAKKSPDSSKKSADTSKKSAAKKSTETSKKHTTTATKRSTTSSTEGTVAKKERKKRTQIEHVEKMTKRETPSKSKAEAKSTTKKSKEEKHKEEKSKKEEKDDGDKKSKIIDSAESGSTNEGDIADSGSGDFGSGDLGSGSGSGSGDDEPVAAVKPVEPKVIEKEVKKEVAKKSTTTTKKSKIAKPDKVAPAKVAKSNLGEFTLPDKKTVVSTASLTLDEQSEIDESGSGSGSGDDTEPEEKVVLAKKAEIKKAKSGGKATVKKSTTHVKAPAAPKHSKKSKVVIKVKKSKKPDKPSKKSKVPKPQKEKHIISKSKKSEVPEKPKKLTSYPKIDLKLIASALAHYEEAALELAGEYPKAPQVSNEVARSTIPRPPAPEASPAVAPKAAATVEAINPRTIIPRPHHHEETGPPLPSFENKKELIIDPLDKYKQNLEIAKLLTDDRNGRSTIPKYLKLTKDVKNGGTVEEPSEYAADSLPSIQKRFNILGIEPTLIDYYAETGKINPFAQKHKKKEKNVRKSNIANNDPYEYLRNMPAGASMLPIDDPKARSKIPSDHSYPVFLMKVSPGERKYIDEPPMRRGEIRHLNAEGVRIDDKTEVGGLPKEVVQKLKGKAASAAPAHPKENEAAKKTQQPSAPKVPAAVHAPAVPVTPNPFANGGLPMYANPFFNNAEQAMAMMSVAANLQNNLLRAQNGMPQAKTVVPNAPRPAAPQVKKPAAVKGAVPRPAARPLTPPFSPAAIKAMEKSAITNGLQYAQNQMKINELNKLIARSRAQLSAPGGANARQTIRINPAQKYAQQRGMVKFDIAKATSPHINPGLTGETPVNELNSLKNKMVSAFFPMKKDGVGAEGSGEAAKG